MQTVKETVSNIAASAISGKDKTKATLEEKAEKMKTSDPVEKQMATQKKEAKINQAEMQKRETQEYNAAMKQAAGTGTGTGTGNCLGLGLAPHSDTGHCAHGTGTGLSSATHSTTEQVGHGTGAHQMSALPGHGTGYPTGHVVEGTAVTEPIGTNTGTGRTTAHNTRAGGGAGGYGTGGGYTG